MRRKCKNEKIGNVKNGKLTDLIKNGRKKIMFGEVHEMVYMKKHEVKKMVR